MTDVRTIKTFPQLVKYLRDELDWPIESTDFEELTFDYAADELGLDANTAVKVKEIKQLRPLETKQPWGIFFVNFEPRKLPVIALRRILRSLVLKKRQSSNKSQQATWQLHDLMFISSYGETNHRDITFAHFSEDPEHGDLPVLRVLGWDDQDTALHSAYTEKMLQERLRWPKDSSDIEKWRSSWSSAFTLRHMQVIRTSKELAIQLADLASKIRKRVKAVLAIESEKGSLRKLHAAFKEALIHDLTEDDFADMYAQTISYGLLTARVSRPSGPVADNLKEIVPVTNPFLKELLETCLTVGGRKGKVNFDELGISEVVGLLQNADMEAVLRDFGDQNPQEDPVIHFYELFLKEYDPEKRVKQGVFYTPRPVVSFIVRNVDQILRKDFGLKLGLASTETWEDMAKRHPHLKIPQGVAPSLPFVQILDPATGTGTFLVEVIEIIYETMREKWHDEGHMELEYPSLWNEYVPKNLLARLYGFELMMAPYAIAHMKIPLKLKETGFTAWDRLSDIDRVRIFLTDSLEPHQDFSGRLAFDVPELAREAQAVNQVKDRGVFTVIVGNPPYLREKERGPGERAERIGGWVRFGDNDGNAAPIFDDFIKPLTELNQGVHAKLAYELSVMFWRLALWIGFEKHSCPGVIGMISPRAYIAGPGHVGMRQSIRGLATDFWITDLGGDNRGARKSDNIFEIETGVAIGICVKSPRAHGQHGVHYREVEGTAEDKLAALRNPQALRKTLWRDSSSDNHSFMPASKGLYAEWPKLTDLFPWQHSGTQFKRLWPIAESQQVLEQRWRRLVSLPPDQRAAAFVETDARLVSSGNQRSRTLRHTGIASLAKDAPFPLIQRYCYRSLDRQWAFIDERFADRLRPSLVLTLGSQQVFAMTLMSKQLGAGPSISVTNLLPDMDVFCNRGAKDIIPLWRDASAKQANVLEGLVDLLTARFNEPVSNEDLFCYCAAILGSPAYASKFESELATPGPRIPMTADAQLFRRGALLGARFIWLQTYGERWLSSKQNGWKDISGSAKVKRQIPEDEEHYPREFAYDKISHTLCVGDGVISGVSPEVFGYALSGFKVVESWLRYRMKERGGRAKRESTRSELDEIRPSQWLFTRELLELLWVVEGCIRLWLDLELFLTNVITSKHILASELPAATEAQQQEPQSSSYDQHPTLL
jgi:hypothetical protein